MKNRITELFDIQYPVIQGGMIWCSGWKLASAVSNCGGLGLLGAGSMYPEILQEHIDKMHKATDKPFGVNLPLLYPDIEKHIDIIIKSNVKIVFTSAGSPKKWTSLLQEHGIKVAHVVSSAFFAKKCEDAGVDAVVAEGFEAGGHNGREETTTMSLIPDVRKAISVPLIAAGGISGGNAMLAARALGAEGVQIGSLFAAAKESSAHDNFKQRIVAAREGETVLTLKQSAPVRLIKNAFYEQVTALDKKGAADEEYKELLGRGRAKKAIFEGNLDDGEIEIGQISSMITGIHPVSEIFERIKQEYNTALASIRNSEI